MVLVWWKISLLVAVSCYTGAEANAVPDLSSHEDTTIPDNTVLTTDEIAGEELLRRSFIKAAQRADRGFYHRQRAQYLASLIYEKDQVVQKRDNLVHRWDTVPQKKDDFSHGYHFTIPNDFIVGDYKEDNEPNPAFQRPSNPLLPDPHPAVENANNMETQVSSLLASAGSLKMQSVQLESKAKQLEKQAQMLHAQAGGPPVHLLDTPIKAPESSKKAPDNSADGGEQLKSGHNGQGPERGGDNSRPVVNGQTLPGGADNAPATPTLGPPTFEQGEPTQDINTGYPMYQLPPRSGEYTIPVYHKPLPPLLGPNPYEVLTSASLNGTAYKFPQFVPAVEDLPAGIPLFKPPSQKYIVSLKGLKATKPKSEKGDKKSVTVQKKHDLLKTGRGIINTHSKTKKKNRKIVKSTNRKYKKRRKKKKRSTTRIK